MVQIDNYAKPIKVMKSRGKTTHVYRPLRLAIGSKAIDLCYIRLFICSYGSRQQSLEFILGLYKYIIVKSMSLVSNDLVLYALLLLPVL